MTVKDPLGRVTTTVFDALDRPTVVIDPHVAAARPRPTTATARSSRSPTRWAAITTTTYDNRGWVATVTDPLGNVATYSYTATGKASTVTNPGKRRRIDRVVLLRQGRPADRRDRRQRQHHQLTRYDGVGNTIAVTDANNQHDSLCI